MLVPKPELPSLVETRIYGSTLSSADEATYGVDPYAPGLYDGGWNDAAWKAMIERLVADRVVTWREITTTILGELNPGQVGTGIASADSKKFGFKQNHAVAYPGESFMPYVMRWFYAQSGRCVDCGTRLDLQADHVKGRENFIDPRDADRLDNLTLRCRRHNVAKRNSHRARAGRTVLPAQQALMWILFEIKPVTKRDFARLCRLYGMTMADIRFDEAWAMAVWLEHDGNYRIAKPSDRYDLLRWPDNIITRRFASTGPVPESAELLASDVTGTSVLCLVSTRTGIRLHYTELPLSDIPFTYRLGDRPATDIAIWPTQHGRTLMPPRGQTLHTWAIRGHDEHTVIQIGGHPDQIQEPSLFTGTYFRGRTIRLRSAEGITLRVES